MKPNARGFTIIEVLFVLAIAGLILLIVFQAIPALTRSSRNSQRKQDAATILHAVSHYELSNSGNFPLDCNGAGPTCDAVKTDPADPPNPDPAYPNDYFLNTSMRKLTFYQNTDISLTAQQRDKRATQTGPNDAEKIQIFNYEKCSSTSIGTATWPGAGFNDVVALYDLESGGSTPTAQCQQL